MMNIQMTNDLAKETLTIINCFDTDIINKIPKRFLNLLSEMASTSSYILKFDNTKRLIEQDISEQSKDLIALIYYDYIADEKEKKEIVKLWNENENNIYNTDDLFKKNKNKDFTETVNVNDNSNSLIEYKEPFFKRIINFIKKFGRI